MDERAKRPDGIIDRTGRKVLPIGRDGFSVAAASCVLVDKTMLIADILDSGYAATLFCRPRRFGKTLNMTMLRAFLDVSAVEDPVPLFEGTRIWGAADGYYRQFCHRYPVVYLSMRTAKGMTWLQTYGALKGMIAAEYIRHSELFKSDRVPPEDRAYAKRIAAGDATESEYADSLLRLTRMLSRHYGQHAVVLIDEYDAPVMAGYSAPNGGYYAEIVNFLKRWLTGALKDGGEALAFACLTGVQRISKESVFSDLNNLVVNTPLSLEFDEYFGFTVGEVAALADYLGHGDCVEEARSWYDGYRFGAVDVCNPWSMLNYLRQGCTPGTYWSNTSSNGVIASLVRDADNETLAQVCGLLEPGGEIAAPLDLGVVFPDVGVRPGAVWSMLYLSGYLTTDITSMPDDYTLLRPLRIPNREVAQLFRQEIIARFGSLAGGVDKLSRFRRALVSGDAPVLAEELSRIAEFSASSFDLLSENSCHMLMLGLSFGLPGYQDPRSNREAGYGRFDIQIDPAPALWGSHEVYGISKQRPRITVEIKFSKAVLDEGALRVLAERAVEQVRERDYDAAPLHSQASGRLRWGVAFAGRQVAAVCEWV